MHPHAPHVPVGTIGQDAAPVSRARLLALLLSAALVGGCASTGTTASSAPDAPVASPEMTVDPASPVSGDAAGTPIEPDTAVYSPATAADTSGVVDTPVADTSDATAPTHPQAPAGSPAPTAAELDYAAIYGGGTYDPVADPTLPPPAAMPASHDPWQRYNRRMHRFNNAVDRTVARPLARAYVTVVPRPVRLGVRNFFSNLGQPVSAVNALLQGKPKQAAHAVGRFLLNSTLGIGGVFDPASDARLSRRSEDFGQTLGVWGWERSRYVELPLFGPRTVRDVFGMVGDAPLSPLRQVEDGATRIPLQGLQLVDVRTQLLATDSLREGAADDYALVRDAWMQRRQYQIFGDRMEDTDETALPDYLQDDNLPLVPAGAVPVMPIDG
jgi:phospholipid-binding lipoprotein MlaA